MNIFEALPKFSDKEDFLKLYESDNVKVKRIVSPIGCELETEWYDQKEKEFVLVIQGSAQIKFEDEVVDLKKGDTLFIESHRKHIVTKTSDQEDTIWLALYFTN